jgi:hypothetical protein
MRFFSVELKSKSDLKNVTLTNGSSNSVLLEGTIGELLQAKFAEGIILEVVGKDGNCSSRPWRRGNPKNTQTKHMRGEKSRMRKPSIVSSSELVC